MARHPKTDEGFLPELFIQQLEQRNPEALLVTLQAEGIENLAKLFVRLLKSYRAAATVANAAWKLKELEPRETSPLAAWSPRAQEVRAQLLQALEGYSPANFPSSAPKGYAKKLEELYNQIEFETSMSGVLDLIYEEIEKALKMEAGQ